MHQNLKDAYNADDHREGVVSHMQTKVEQGRENVKTRECKK